MKPQVIAALAAICPMAEAFAQNSLWIYGIDGGGTLIRTELGSAEIEPIMETGLTVASGLTRGPGDSIFAMDATRGAYQIDPGGGTILSAFEFDSLDPNSSYPGLSAGLAYDRNNNTLFSLRGASIGYGAPDNNLYLTRMNLDDMSVAYTRTDVVVYGPNATHSLQPNIAIRDDGAIITALDRWGGSLSSQLMTIDPVTGSFSEFAMLPDLDGMPVSGLSVLGDNAYISAASGSTTLIYQIDLYTGSTTYLATVQSDLFGMVVNPTPSVLAPLAALGLVASKRRRYLLNT